MKRILLFLLATVAVVGACAAGPLLSPVERDYTVRFVTSRPVENLPDCTCVANGSGAIVSVVPAKAWDVYERLGEVEGVTLVLADSSAGELYKLVNRYAVRIAHMEEVEGIFCVYGYSPYVSVRPVRAFGADVNVQFALSGDTLHIGMPMVLTDY